jgi:hypothetical protein
MCVCVRAYVWTDKQSDARCISNALLAYGGEVAQDGRGWAVQLSAPGAPELTAVLAALKICLDENAIAVVKVEIDGQVYAMEGLPEAV